MEVLSFIDNALYDPTRDPLPYTDPTQKSIIRAHLLETLRNFPSLTLCLDTFTFLNGAVTTLFKLSGDLQTPDISVTVTLWVHQDYPYVSPMLFTTPDHFSSINDHNTWRHPSSSILTLLRSLVTTFADHKNDVLDTVMGMIQYDLIAMEARHVAEMDAHLAIQAELQLRGDSLDRTICLLENEKLGLERLNVDLRAQCDVLANWVSVNGSGSGEVEGELFEVADEESRWLVECLAGDKAVEDVMYAMDKAIQERVMEFDVYMRYIRVLARQQFFLRAQLVKFKGSRILHHFND